MQSEVSERAQRRERKQYPEHYQKTDLCLREVGGGGIEERGGERNKTAHCQNSRITSE